jgi:release factor glutamine methyltransferase
MFAAMTMDEANRQLIASLSALYDEREAAAITSLVMEKLSGMSKSLRVLHKRDILPAGQEKLFRQYLEGLLQHRPVQYVLEEAWFAGLRFYVNEQVLIPRPETEELLNWVLETLPAALPPDFSLLDIGTGSGCIPVAIGKKRSDVRLLACDISQAALDIAQKNSRDNSVAVHFFQCDIRDSDSWEGIPPVNCIVSNPPYIPEKQKAQLDPHVRLYEPGLALFVPDQDPLLFYKLIGRFAKRKLLPAGKIFLELHHDFSGAVLDWYRGNGFRTRLRKDLPGKNRMLLAEP